MRRDAQGLADGTTLEVDLCIVGSGPAGIALAQQLIGREARVICLESGGLEAEVAAQLLNRGCVVGEDYGDLQQTRHRQIGGTTRIWNTPLDAAGMGAKYVPLDPVDFEARPGPALSGWPFDSRHMASYYARAQTLCELGADACWGGHTDAQRDAKAQGNECEHESPATFALPDPRLRRALYRFGPARPFAETLPRRIEACANVELLYHATACALELRGRSVVAVEAANARGERFRVRSRLFVLAAGAIENARLLLVSRQPGAAAPGDEHGWLGRCFMEHPRDRRLCLVPSRPELYSEAAFYDRHRAADGTQLGGRLALARQVVTEERLPNASVTLLPRLRDPPRGRRWIERIRRHLPWVDPPASGYGWSRLSDPERRFSGFALLLNLEQFPQPENRVVLGSTVDRLGVPRPELQWSWRASEQGDLQRLRAIVTEALSAAAIGRIEAVGPERPDPNAHHHAGTTRMHEQAQLGVVDADSRVHGFDNLYVTGSAVFPSAGYANPTLTIVALALRLADHLEQRL